MQHMQQRSRTRYLVKHLISLVAFFASTISAVGQISDTTVPNFSSIWGPAVSPTLEWEAVSGAVRYELQVSYSPGFSWLVLDDSNIVITLKPIGPLTPDTGYYCRLRAIAGEETSAWSSNLRFYAESGSDVFALEVQKGWNLLSFPLSVSDATRNFLFPGPCPFPTIFCYNGSYGCCGEYSPQKSYGFWSRFPESQLIGVTGIPATTDTESLMDGWNLIGSIFVPLPVDSLITNPPDLLRGNVTGYSNMSYTVTDTIRPFEGYWVRSAGAGQIILSHLPEVMSQIVVYVHWLDQPIAGKKIVLVETQDTTTTDASGLARFVLPSGHYTVRAFDINRGGPVQLSIDYDVLAQPGEKTTVDIIDCLPCD